MEQVEVSVEELLSGLSRRGMPLPFEIGAFIALEACEQMVDRPIRVDARDIGIGDIGEVVCAAKKSPVSEESAVRALMLLLSELLVRSAPGVPSMLLELVERGPSSGEWTLDRLRDDLEACLVPLNRGATRRVLARLTREARKAGLDHPSSRPSVVPAASEIDAQFDALMGSGGDAGPAAVPAISRAASAASATAFASSASPTAARAIAPNASPTPRGSFRREDEVPTLEFETARAERSAGAQAASLRALRSAAAASEARGAADSRPPRQVADHEVKLLEHGDERGRAGGRKRRQSREDEHYADRDERSSRPSRGVNDLLDGISERDRRSRAPMWIGGVLAVAAVALAGAYIALGQAGARRVLGLDPIVEAPLPDVSAVTTRSTRLAGELRINSVPGRAQVFLFVGNGPANAMDLPIGVAQEFVAMAEGHAPTRAVVPADAQWEAVTGSDQPRYELAMQANKLESPEKALELGPTLLSQDVGTPTGRVGTARIITTPKGAKVYQLIGFTPDVHVENLPLETGYEVLVFLPGYGLQTRRVEPADFREVDGNRVAELIVPLTAARRR